MKLRHTFGVRSIAWLGLETALRMGYDTIRKALKDTTGPLLQVHRRRYANVPLLAMGTPEETNTENGSAIEQLECDA